jgi:DNA-binding GntR family transcriptional regulator
MVIAPEFKGDAFRNLSAALADQLSQMIQTGVLKPGAHLVQTELATRFGVSRVASRDALQQLLQKGLAVNVPRKGVVVRPISLKNVRDLFEARRYIESQVVRLASPHLTDKDFECLDRLIHEQEQCAQAQDLAHFIEKDWEFHQAIYNRCNNEPLKEIVALLWSRTRQARGVAQANPKWGKEWSKNSTERHRRVLKALRKRDAETAARLIAGNIDTAAEELVDGLREIGWGENNHSH